MPIGMAHPGVQEAQEQARKVRIGELAPPAREKLLNRVAEIQASDAAHDAKKARVTRLLADARIEDDWGQGRTWAEMYDRYERAPGILEVAGEALSKPSRLLPWVGVISEGAYLKSVHDAAGRLSEGQGTKADDELVAQFILESRRPDPTWGGTVASIMSQLPAFWAEFALTTPAFAAGKALGKAGAKKAIGGFLKGKLAGAVGVATGAALQTAASEGIAGALGTTRTYAQVMRERLEGLNLTPDDAGRLAVTLEKTEDDFVGAIWRSYSEMASERSGPVFRLIPGTPLVKEFQAKVFAKLAGKGPGGLQKGLERIRSATGWHGWLEEIGEERVNSALLAIAGEEPWEDVVPSWKQLTAEAAAFAVPGVAAAGLQRATGVPGSVPDVPRGNTPPGTPEAAPTTPQAPTEGGVPEVPASPQEEASPSARPSTAPPEAARRAVAEHFQRQGRRGRVVQPTEPDDLWAQEFEEQRGRTLLLVEADDGKPLDVPASSGAGYTILDANARGGKQSLIFHEAVHGLDEEAKAALIERVRTSYPKLWAAARDQYAREYAETGVEGELTEAILDEEATARAAEDAGPLLELLYDSPQELEQLYRADRPLWQKVMDALIGVLNLVPGVELRPSLQRDLDRLRGELASAVHEELSNEEFFQLGKDIQAALDTALGAQLPVSADTGGLEEGADVVSAVEPVTEVTDVTDEDLDQAIEEEIQKGEAKAGQSRGKGVAKAGQTSGQGEARPPRTPAERRAAKKKAAEEAPEPEAKWRKAKIVPTRAGVVAVPVEEEPAPLERPGVERDLFAEAKKGKDPQLERVEAKLAAEEHDGFTSWVLGQAFEGFSPHLRRQKDKPVEVLLELARLTEAQANKLSRAKVKDYLERIGVKKEAQGWWGGSPETRVRLWRLAREAVTFAAEMDEWREATVDDPTAEQPTRPVDFWRSVFIGRTVQEDIDKVVRPGVDRDLFEAAKRDGLQVQELAHRIAEKKLDRKEAAKLLPAPIKVLRDEAPELLRQFEEALEYAIVLRARETIDVIAETAIRFKWDRARRAKETYRALVDLYAEQPRIGLERSSTQIARQQFSTPVPLSFLLSHRIGLDEGKTVYEPTAGNGNLLIAANPGRTWANEIDETRAANLRDTFAKRGTVTSEDVLEGYNPKYAAAPPKADVVLANPPFGRVKRGKETQQWRVKLPGKEGLVQLTLKNIDHVIALRALEGMQEGAVLLVAGPHPKALQSKTDETRQKHYQGGESWKFWTALYDHYDVVDHFTLAGKLYTGQGSAWPIDVVTIQGRGKAEKKPPFSELPKVYDSWDALGDDFLRLEPLGRRSGAVGDPSAPPAPERPAGVVRVVEPGEGPAPEPPAETPEGGRGGGPRPPSPVASGGGERAPGERERPPVRGRRGSRAQPGKPGVAGGAAGEAEPEGGEAGPGADVPGVAPGRPAAAQPPRVTDAELDAAIFDEIAKAEGGKPGEKGDDWSDELDRLFAVRPENFDEARYRTAIPVFRKAAEHLEADMADPVDLVRKVVQYLRDVKGWAADRLREVAVYVREFAKDVAEWVRPADRASGPETAFQTAYKPQSKAPAAGTLTPSRMQAALTRALSELEERIGGSVDAFVAEKLGYDLEAITEGRHFFAEQVDALALAIDNVERGAAFVIGDQTGVGKGRVVAGMMRYAIHRGLVPVFVTAKKGLYKDIFRDLEGIGSGSMRAFTTDDTLRGRQALKLESGKVFRSLPKGAHEEAIAEIERTGLAPEGFDAVFTTYDQMNFSKGMGQKSARHHAMDRLIPNALIILDESHRAGGSEGSRAKYVGGLRVQTRAEYFREFVAKAGGVFYSSATFAKNPATMTLYARTDMGLAVNNPDELETAMKLGGVPLEEAVNHMLTQVGQYARREMSMEGVELRKETLQTETATAEVATSLLRRIFAFDLQMAEARKDLAEVFIKEEQAKIEEDAGIGEIGATSTGFASLMHNVVTQMLVALKAEQAAHMAADLVERDEKPVIALSNTFETLLRDYAEDQGIQIGDSLEGYDFSVIFRRYLDRTREILLADAYGFKKRRRITDLDLERAGHGQLAADFRAIQEEIQSAPMAQLSASPIDRMIAILQSRGVKVGELTGRQSIAEETERGVLYQSRQTSDALKNETMAAFNAGKLDALILNRSAAEGYSLHASKDFRDQKKRHMLVLQAEPDINIFMQILGRVNRTGQRVPPELTLLVSDLPAERRPAAILMKKLASLNANTSANRRSHTTIESVVDFINEFGDQVAVEFLQEEPRLAAQLGIAAKEGKKAKDADKSGEDPNQGLIKKLTGRLAILPIPEQEEILDRIEANYLQHIDNLEKMGIPTLEAPVLELDAKVLDAQEITQGVEGGSLFQRPAMLETVDVRRTIEPLSWEEVVEKVEPDRSAELLEFVQANAEAVGKERAEDEAAAKWQVEITEQSPLKGLGGEEAEKWRKRLAADKKALVRAINLTLRHASDLRTLEDSLRELVPGVEVEIDAGDEVPFYGVISSQRRKGKSRNPLALSDYELVIYTTQAKAALSIPLSKVARGTFRVRAAAPGETEAAFHEASKAEAREIRQIITGNLLAGYATLGEKREPLVWYTTSEGETRQGIFVRRSRDMKEDLDARPVELTLDQVIEFLDRAPLGIPVTEEGGRFHVKKGRSGYQLVAAARGGKPWYLNESAIAAVGDFAQRKGQKMWTTLPTQDAGKVKKALRAYETELKSSWQAEDNLDLAREITGQERLMAVRKGAIKEEEEPLFDETGFPRESFREMLARKVANYFGRVVRYQDELEKLGIAIPEAQDVALMEERWMGKAEDAGRRFRLEHVDPLVKLMGDAGISPEEAHLYLYARHAPRRNQIIAERNPEEGFGQEVNPGSGMKRSRAQAILKKAHEGEQADAYRELGRRADAMNQASRDLKVRYGLISQETADEWEKTWGPHYVPLRTDVANTAPIRAGRGFDIRGPESKMAKGRQSLADNVLAFSMLQFEETIIRGEKNLVGQALYKLVKANPDKALWRIQKGAVKRVVGKDGVTREEVLGLSEEAWKSTYSVKIDGKEKWIRFSDPLMARAMKQLAPKPQAMLVRFSATALRLLAKMVTSLSPDFLIPNFFRDLQTAGIHLAGEQKKGMWKDVMGATLSAKPQRAVWYGLREKEPPAHLKEWVDAFNEMRAHGGKIGWYHAQNIQGRLRSMERQLRDLDPSKPRQVAKAMAAPFEFIEDANGAVENGVRLAAYYYARKAGASPARAASMAKNLTVNFNRRGELGPFFNSFYMFANASVQGTARMVKFLTTTPAGRKIAAGIVASGFLMDFLGRATGGEDDDGENRYDKIPDYVKARNLIVMLPWTDGDYIKIPLPYGYNLFYALGQNASAVTAGKKKTAAAGDVISAAWEAFNPIGSESSFLQMVMPTLADPVVQVAENQKFYGAPIRPGQVGYGPDKPDSQLYWSTVNPRLKELTAWMNERTGGDKWTSGWLDVSPETLEHYLEFVGGGAGKTGLQLWKLPEKVLASEEVMFNDVPVVRRFLGEEPSFYVRNKFYENLEELELVRHQYREAREERAMDSVAEARENPLFRLSARAAKVRRQASTLRGRIEVAPNDEERKRRVQRLDDFMVRFNREVVQARR